MSIKNHEKLTSHGNIATIKSANLPFLSHFYLYGRMTVYTFNSVGSSSELSSTSWSRVQAGQHLQIRHAEMKKRSQKYNMAY